jgi:hypothetical protein
MIRDKVTNNTIKNKIMELNKIHTMEMKIHIKSILEKHLLQKIKKI